jgi:hypothetical protein
VLLFDMPGVHLLDAAKARPGDRLLFQGSIKTLCFSNGRQNEYKGIKGGFLLPARFTGLSQGPGRLPGALLLFWTLVGNMVGISK